MLSDALHDPEGCGGFLFREEIDLEVEVGAALALSCHLILADQYPDGEEDRFQRYDQREQAEGEWIERFEAPDEPRVCEEPDHEPHEMCNGEGRRAGRPGDDPRDPFAGGSRL